MIQWTDEQIQRAWEDFRVFLFIVWTEIGLPAPTAIQNDMAYNLQYPPNDRFILEGFRGVAKSFITCAFVAWKLWKNPQLKVLIVSAGKDRADANAIFIKKIFQTVPFLQYLLPTREQRDTQNIFDVSPATPDISPSVKSVGITGQITGTRADLLVADDVEIPNNSGTQVQRDKLNESVREFDAILKPGGQIVYLGTPQNEMSLYNELQKRGYVILVYPIIYPETVDERNQYKTDEYGDTLAPFIAKVFDENPMFYSGKPTDSSRFNEEEIDKRRLSYGKAGFALQFLLNTNLSDAEKYPLKVSDLIIDSLAQNETSLTWAWSNGQTQRYNNLPCVALKGDYFYAPLSRSQEVNKYSGTIMTIDPSGRGKDETAYSIVKFLNGYLFVMDVGGYQEGYETSVLRSLATKAKFYGVNICLVEPNFGSGMFAQLLTPIMNEIHPGCAVEDAKSAKGQKECRIIDTLEPVMMQHRLIFDTKVIENDYKVYEKAPAYSLIYQMTRLSKERGALAHDDRIDALAMAVEYWIDCMSMDKQQGLDEIAADQLEKWLDPDYGVLHKDEPNTMQSLRKVGNSFGNINMKDVYLFSS